MKMNICRIALIVACPLTLMAQYETPQLLIQKVKQEQAQVRTISYRLGRTDTLVTGQTRRITGEGYIQRNSNNSAIQFRLHRSDVNAELAQTGGRLLFIDYVAKQYSLNEVPIAAAEIELKPCGQMYVPDLLDVDTSDAIRITAKNLVLTIHRKDIADYDVTNRYKQITIDPVTYLPKSVRLHQETAGKTQDLFFELKNVQINNKRTEEAIAEATVPAGFALMKINHDDESLLIGQRATPFTLESFEYKYLSMTALHNKLVLLDFWEVWCGPCLASMHDVDELYKKYHSQGLEVIGIMLKPEQLEQAKRILAKRPVHFMQAIGSEEIRKEYKVDAIPRYVLIDREGKIAFAASGYSKDVEEAIRQRL
jgi:thiol-disulfide isomerase/thioredoxin